MIFGPAAKRGSAVYLRASTPEDVDSLYGIWQRSVGATHDFVSAADIAAIAVVVREQYLPSAAFTLACNVDDRILAFMGMSGSEIDSLFVDADMRGQRVGRALIEKARGLSPFGLTVEVNEQNLQAVGFYERMDFRVIGRTPLDHQGRPYPLLQMTWAPDDPTR